MHLQRPNDAYINAFAFCYPVATLLFIFYIIAHLSNFFNSLCIIFERSVPVFTGRRTHVLSVGAGKEKGLFARFLPLPSPFRRRIGVVNTPSPRPINKRPLY